MELTLTRLARDTGISEEHLRGVLTGEEEPHDIEVPIIEKHLPEGKSLPDAEFVEVVRV